MWSAVLPFCIYKCYYMHMYVVRYIICSQGNKQHGDILNLSKESMLLNTTSV